MGSGIRITLPTYFVSEKVTGPSGGGPGGTDKDMMTILNPSGSGKTILLWELIVQCIASAGTNVIVEYELASITSHTAGTTVTPKKREASDGAAAAEVRTEPTAVGAYTRLWTHAFQSNTIQAPDAFGWKFGPNPETKPFTLAEGEGLCVHQVTSNGGDFAISLVWTEE